MLKKPRVFCYFLQTGDVSAFRRCFRLTSVFCQNSTRQRLRVFSCNFDRCAASQSLANERAGNIPRDRMVNYICKRYTADIQKVNVKGMLTPLPQSTGPPHYSLFHSPNMQWLLSRSSFYTEQSTWSVYTLLCNQIDNCMYVVCTLCLVLGCWRAARRSHTTRVTRAARVTRVVWLQVATWLFWCLQGSLPYLLVLNLACSGTKVKEKYSVQR